MDFSVIFQLRNKKYWWLDVILYLAVSMLVATVFCWLVFALKSSVEQVSIKNETSKLQNVGTEDQKSQETEVLGYKRRIADFNSIFANHRFASNAFALMQSETLPYIWFKQFSMDQKNASMQLQGQTDSMDEVGRQVANFENSKYVQKVGLLSSSVGNDSKINFNLSLLLDPKIFSYLSDLNLASIQKKAKAVKKTSSQSDSTTSTDNSGNFGNDNSASDQSASSDTSATSTSSSDQSSSQSGTTTTPITTTPSDNSQNNKNTKPTGNQPTIPAKSSSKDIISFNLPLEQEVVGQIDLSAYTVSLTVPYGTDLTNLTPAISISDMAIITPMSGIPQDFSSPVIYQVTAQDGSTQNYTVSVNVAPKPASKPSQSNMGFIIILVVSLVVIVIAAAVVSIILRKMNKA